MTTPTLGTKEAALETRRSAASGAGRFVGLDIGTTSISLAVLDGDGGLVERRTIANDAKLPSPQGDERLQDPGRIWTLCRQALDDALAAHPRIAAIGVTGQMHGVVYLDDAGQPASPLVTWQDGRGDRPRPDGQSYADHLSRLTGYRQATGFGLTTHYFLTQTGALPAGGRQLATIADYIAMTLAGLPAPILHPSMAASLGLYQTDANAFDLPALAAAGISPDALPQVSVEEKALGEYRGVPVSPGLGDNQASFLGSVGTGERVLLNIGTGSQISILDDGGSSSGGQVPDAKSAADDAGRVGQPASGAAAGASGDWAPGGDGAADVGGCVCDIGGGLEIRPYLAGGRLLTGAALCGGAAYAILADFFKATAQFLGSQPPPDLYDRMNRAAAEWTGDGLMIDPRFAGTRQDPSLRGAISGIGRGGLTPQALAGAMLHGIAAELRQFYAAGVAPGSQPDHIVASGNAVRANPALRGILAEVFGRPLRTPIHDEEAAAGAALFGALAAGQLTSLADAQATIRY